MTVCKYIVNALYWLQLVCIPYSGNAIKASYLPPPQAAEKLKTQTLQPLQRILKYWRFSGTWLSFVWFDQMFVTLYFLRHIFGRAAWWKSCTFEQFYRIFPGRIFFIVEFAYWFGRRHFSGQWIGSNIFRSVLHGGCNWNLLCCPDGSWFLWLWLGSQLWCVNSRVLSSLIFFIWQSVVTISIAFSEISAFFL